jgi:hypothetical protein
MQSGGSLSSEMVMSNLKPMGIDINSARGVDLLESTVSAKNLNSVKLYSPLSGGGKKTGVSNNKRSSKSRKSRKVKKMKKQSGGSRSRRGPCRKNSRTSKHTRKNKKSHRRSQRGGYNKNTDATTTTKHMHGGSSDNKKMQKGGGSDWISSQYSAGPSNNAMQDPNMTALFTTQKGMTSAEMNAPSSIGLAGSGYPMTEFEGGNIGRVGAPISF